MRSDFGLYIKNLRTYKNLTKTELAKLSKIDRTTIIAIENGTRRMPKAETIIKLAKALECNDIELLKIAGYRIEDKDIKVLEYELVISGFITVSGDSNNECLANGDKKIFDAVHSLKGKSSKFDEIAQEAEMNVSLKIVGD